MGSSPGPVVSGSKIPVCHSSCKEMAASGSQCRTSAMSCLAADVVTEIDGQSLDNGSVKETVLYRTQYLSLRLKALNPKP